MKQVLQNLSNGDTSLVDVPSPKNIKSNILIATTTTVVSAGTERMLVNFGKSGYISKAKQQPDKVKMVLNKVATDGLMTTINAVRSKLDQPLPLGYCNAGVILESEVDEIMDKILNNQAATLWRKIYNSIKKGYIDIPFSPHVINNNRLVTVRDNNNNIRIYNGGNLPLSDKFLNFERSKLNSISTDKIVNTILSDIGIML